MSLSSTKVLFFAEGATLAHVLRPFALARDLDPDRFKAWRNSSSPPRASIRERISVILSCTVTSSRAMVRNSSATVSHNAANAARRSCSVNPVGKARSRLNACGNRRI